MKKIIFALVVILGLLLAPRAASAGTFARYGVGIFNSAEYGTTETKAFSLGYEDAWFGPFIHQWEGGVYADQGGNGRKSSGFGNASAGVEVDPGYAVIRSLWGVGAITTPDTMLGGVFQFNQDLLLGLRDDKQNMIGLDYKHMSSAGLESPNKGRDFLLLQVEIPW